jgi:colanic acid biosynthesis glycosyl transferase WcaI
MPIRPPALRVILWGINYAPEPTGIAVYNADLARYFKTQGIDVEVIAGFSYYPAWQKKDEDRGRLYRRDTLDDVPVHRCWQYVPGKVTKLARIIHEASFAVTSVWKALLMPRADLYVVVSPPLGLGPVAWLISKFKRSRYLFHVQDLQPDSAAELGMLKEGVFLRAMRRCERLVYAKSAGVSGISTGMIEAFLEKGVPREKVFLLPNWLRLPRVKSDRSATSSRGSFRCRHGISDNALLAVYSGNLGKKQGLDVIFDAAELLHADTPTNDSIQIVVVGDGAERSRLEARLRERPLGNLRLLPLLSDDDYRDMLDDADLALITQQPGTGQVCFPSKLLSVLAVGLPVVTAADESSDLAKAVKEGGFGRNVPAADGAALAAVLSEVSADRARLAGWASRTLWVERFAPEVVLPQFEAVVLALADTRISKGAAVERKEVPEGTAPRKLETI